MPNVPNRLARGKWNEIFYDTVLFALERVYHD